MSDTNDRAVMLAARLAVVLEKAALKVRDGALTAATAVLEVANWAETKAEHFRQVHVLVLGMKRPTLEQWINRLVEHVDSNFLLYVYQRFLVLIENGWSPEDAFTEVVGTDVS